MTGKVYRSKCCNAKVKADGMPDFLGSKEACTVSYICLKCNKPCNVAALKDQKQKVRAVKEKQRALKKRIKEGERRLDFQGEMLQKLVELFDGITIHPVKGVILTPKKKRQLAELQKIERKLFKPKIKKPRE